MFDFEDMKIVRKVRFDLQLLQLRRSHSNGLQRGLHQHGVVVLHLYDTIGMGMVNFGSKASTMCITAQQLKRGASHRNVQWQLQQCTLARKVNSRMPALRRRNQTSMLVTGVWLEG